MASHDERVRAIHTGFVGANTKLSGQVEQLDERKATLNPPEGWNAAQIAWHVALTTEFLAGAIGGSNASMLVAKPDGFTEKLATLQLPDKVRTFSMLEPPAGATRAEAVSRLRASEEAFVKALQKVTPERGAAQCVQMPFGVFSLYEIGEFTAAHVVRHIGQVQRTLAAV